MTGFKPKCCQLFENAAVSRSDVSHAARDTVFARALASPIVILTMAQTPDQQNAIPTFRDLYPHLSDAEDRFDRYLALAVRIFERLKDDPTFPDRLKALTAEREALKMSAERSI